VALLPDRVTGVVTFASPAPFTSDFDWYAGMVAPGGLRSAEGGRESRARFAASDEFDERQFVAADWDALGARGGRSARTRAAAPPGPTD
jgi:hypothetical protein